MSAPSLFTPITIGEMELAHRVIHAPLTRTRVEKFPKSTPMEYVVDYYSQRATPGQFLIAEATFISEEAGGFDSIPGIYSDGQVAAWKNVVDAVHERGAFIFLQIVANGYANPGTIVPRVVSSSNKPVPAPSGGAGGNVTEGDNPIIPSPLSEKEIQKYIQAFTQAAKNAVERAGFDGVELHGAHGYLIDQFIQPTVNTRTDRWGGSTENRIRFPLAILDSVSQALGSQAKVGIRLSPYSTFQVMNSFDERAEGHLETFDSLLQAIVLKFPKLAYVHMIEARSDPNVLKDWSLAEGALAEAEAGHPGGPEGLTRFRNILMDTNIAFIAAGGYTRERAEQVVEQKRGAVAFGRLWTSNPDLPERLRFGASLRPYERQYFYADTAEGYTDYSKLRCGS